jgi:hypothetical protein
MFLTGQGRNADDPSVIEDRSKVFNPIPSQVVKVVGG